ncbi:hypothetical protein [Rhodococcus erythropolis]|uniref:hypothetical protein n=1 Tax=Rhodococcus erythropolis TaxID=1833 RepID=UPI001F3C43F8|nr:hypothetical protein [Rhodococcus erythropolis]
MSNNQTRASYLAAQLAVINTEKRLIFEAFGESLTPGSNYTPEQAAELNRLDFEAKSIEAELKTLEQS